MKKTLLAIVLCLVLVGLIAVPVSAVAPPKLTFTTGLASDGNPLVGSFTGGFKLPTTGVSGIPAMHVLSLVNPVATPGLAAGLVPFYMKGVPNDVRTLTAYFAAKPWPQVYLDQINAEINGTAPFFYLDLSNSMLVDGFSYALFNQTKTDLKIDDDYPVNNYFYIGTLVGTNGATLNVNITLKVSPR